jgi:hypothetical protein
MRKITKNAVNAFVNGKSFSSGNTSVQHREEMSFFYLHGNCIATLKNNELYISHCGWRSNTTKERLNGILSAFYIRTIYQKDFNWYLNGAIFDGNAILKVHK